MAGGGQGTEFETCPRRGARFGVNIQNVLHPPPAFLSSTPSSRPVTPTGAAQRWRPVYEALHAASAGTPNYLRRVAQEIRDPEISPTLFPLETIASHIKPAAFGASASYSGAFFETLWPSPRTSVSHAKSTPPPYLRPFPDVAFSKSEECFFTNRT